VSDPPESEDGSVDPPTEEEEATLKELRQGAAYVFPDGTRIAKKVEALAYLRGWKTGQTVLTPLAFFSFEE